MGPVGQLWKGPAWLRLPLRHVVILAVPRGVVSVLPQDLADGDRVARDDAVVAGVTGRLVDDDAGCHRMVVAAGEECGPRRRAERRGVEAGVAQTRVRDAVQCRRGDHAAKGAGRAEANIIGHYQQNVRRALRRHNARRPIRLRLHGVGIDLAFERLRRVRQIPAVDGARRAGRARRAGDLLRKSVKRCQW